MYDKKKWGFHSGVISAGIIWGTLFFSNTSFSIQVTQYLLDTLYPIIPYPLFGDGLIGLLGASVPFFVGRFYVAKLIRYALLRHSYQPITMLFDNPKFKAQQRLNEYVESINQLVHSLDSVGSVYYKKARWFIPDLMMFAIPCILLGYLFLFSDYALQQYPLSNSHRWVILGGILMVSYLMDTKSLFKYSVKKKELKSAYQTAIYKYQESLKEFNQYVVSPFLCKTNESVNHDDGIVFQYLDGKYRGIAEHKMYEHAFLIAPTGVGKTTKIIVPNMFNAQKHSLIINDESSELLNLVTSESSYVSQEERAQFQKRIIKQLNPTKPELSLKWNPLSDIKSYNDANRIAQCMINVGVTHNAESQFWNDQGILLLTIALYFLKLKQDETGKDNLNFKTLKTFLALSRSEIKQLLQSMSDQRLIEEFKLGYGGADDRVASSILNTVTTSIQLYFRDDMQVITSETNFSFNQLRESNMALFLTTPVSDRETYRAYFTLFLSECLSYLNRSDGQSVKLLLDEFGSSFGNIKGLSSHIATLRKKKVSLCLVVQSMDQLKMVYPNGYKTIVSNCLTKLILSSSEYTDCKYMTDLCGTFSYPVIKAGVSEGSNINATIQKNTHSVSDSNSESFSIDIKTNNVIEPTELRELSTNNGVAIMGNKKPFLFEMKAYFDDGGT